MMMEYIPFSNLLLATFWVPNWEHHLHGFSLFLLIILPASIINLIRWILRKIREFRKSRQKPNEIITNTTTTTNTTANTTANTTTSNANNNKEKIS